MKALLFNCCCSSSTVKGTAIMHAAVIFYNYICNLTKLHSPSLYLSFYLSENTEKIAKCIGQKKPHNL